MTTTLAPTTASEVFWSVANDDEGCDSTDPISIQRCVQWLMDLQQSTDDEQLRCLVTETIADLNCLSRLGRDMEDVVLGALASIEVAFEVRAAAGTAYPGRHPLTATTRSFGPARGAVGRPSARPSA